MCCTCGHTARTRSSETRLGATVTRWRHYALSNRRSLDSELRHQDFAAHWGLDFPRLVQASDLELFSECHVPCAANQMRRCKGDAKLHLRLAARTQCQYTGRVEDAPLRCECSSSCRRDVFFWFRFGIPSKLH